MRWQGKEPTENQGNEFIPAKAIHIVGVVFVKLDLEVIILISANKRVLP